MTTCEDAPCCGCCGTSVYGPAEGYYSDEPDAYGDNYDDSYYLDVCPTCQDDECDGEDCEPWEFDQMEDQWLDGSYEE